MRAKNRLLSVTIWWIISLPSALPFSIVLKAVGGAKAAKLMAEKIGLNVVHKSKNNSPAKQKIKQKKTAPPSIQWSDHMQHLFWGEATLSKIKRIENDQGFPLLLFPGLQSSDLLNNANNLLLAESKEEEIEQHELVKGNVSTLRRSLVSQLDPNGDLLNLLLSRLEPFLCPRHPYEDGSVVSYRYAEKDFYAEHHDSYDPNESTLRKRQRAYTVLVYLQSPPGPKENGGTEFTQLSAPNGEKGLVVKPKAGDVLIWPNFDEQGRPDRNSIHRALPIVAHHHQGSGDQNNSDESSTRNNVGKVVVNLWFEGHLVTEYG